MNSHAQGEIDKLFASAKQGFSSCLGRLLTLYSNYLKLLIAAQLDDRLGSGSARRTSSRRPFSRPTEIFTNSAASRQANSSPGCVKFW